MVEIGEIFSSFNYSGIISNVGTVVAIIVAAVLAGFFIYMLYRWKNKKDTGLEKEIYWWEEVNGRMIPLRKDSAEEISIPGTNLKVFYIKKTNTWLPRFVRGITPTMFYVAISSTKEIVNFTLESLDKSMKEAGLTYDHTDMRWAAENMREFVKRNYKDKATPWWKEYQGVITTALYILVMTFSFVIIIYFLRGVITDIGGVAAALEGAVEKINLCAPNTGALVEQGA